MTWRPDTTPLSGEEIRTWRMSQELTDEEYWRRSPRLLRPLPYPTQHEAAMRLSVWRERYYEYERNGTKGVRAALIREHMRTGCDISPYDAPLEWFERLIDHCGTECAALAILGFRHPGKLYGSWIGRGSVPGRKGTGRLLALCVERLVLPPASRIRRPGQQLTIQEVRHIQRLRAQRMTYVRIAEEVGVCLNTARRYARSR